MRKPKEQASEMVDQKQFSAFMLGVQYGAREGSRHAIAELMKLKGNSFISYKGMHPIIESATRAATQSAKKNVQLRDDK